MEQDSEVEKNKDSNEKNLEDSLELFGETKDSFKVEEATEYEIKISKDVTSNILKTSRLVTISTLTIQGYEEVPNAKNDSSTYKLVKNPLASDEVIKSFQGILKTYSDESNIAGKTNWEDFSIQAMSDWKAFYKLCLKEKASPVNSLRTVYRIFQDCIIAVGKIVCDNPDNMGKLFGGINTEARDDDVRRNY